MSPTETIPTSPGRERGPEHKEEHHLPITRKHSLRSRYCRKIARHALEPAHDPEQEPGREPGQQPEHEPGREPGR